MSFDFLRSATASNSAFRVVCGEMIIDDLWNVHSEALIACVREGSVTVEMSTSAHRLNKGDIYFISPNQKYRLDSTDDAKIEVILLNLSNPTSLTQEYIPQSVIRGLVTGNCTHFAKIENRNPINEEIMECINSVIAAETKKHEYFQLLVTGKMYEIFYWLFAKNLVEIFDVETQSKKYRALRRVTEYINDNFCDNITLDSIANATDLSRYYVSHLFKELMNTTFVSYLNELRLNRAAMLLTTTDTPVIEIAGLSGFNNISNFNRAFKMYYDITPSKYRKVEKQAF